LNAFGIGIQIFLFRHKKIVKNKIKVWFIKMSPIPFYVNKPEEVLIDTVRTDKTVTFYVKAPMYSDLELTNKIGILGIKKEVTNIVNDVVTPETFAIYTYDAFWMVPNVKGSSVFVINVGPRIINGGSSELEGIYFGACNDVSSNGDFRNFGGSARKLKDATPIRKYLLSYSSFNPYNTLPSLL
jgi:hypothetical protein